MSIPNKIEVDRDAWVEAKVAELSNLERQAQEISNASQSEVRQANVLLSKADLVLTSRGTGIARILVIKAMDRLSKALVFLEGSK